MSLLKINLLVKALIIILFLVPVILGISASSNPGSAAPALLSNIGLIYIVMHASSIYYTFFIAGFPAGMLAGGVMSMHFMWIVSDDFRALTKEIIPADHMAGAQSADQLSSEYKGHDRRRAYRKHCCEGIKFSCNAAGY